MSLKQFIRRKIAERKEAEEVRKKAEHEERLRLQHLRAQRKLEEHKIKTEKAKASGRRAAIPKKTQIKLKAKEAKEKLTPIAKRALEIGELQAKKFFEDFFKEQKKRRKHTIKFRSRKRRR